MTQKSLKPTVKKRASTALQIVSHPIKSYEAYLQQKRANSIAQKLRVFDNLKALDAGTKSRLRDHVACYIIESVEAYFKFDLFQNIELYLFSFLFIIASIYLLDVLVSIVFYNVTIFTIFTNPIVFTIGIRNYPPIYKMLIFTFAFFIGSVLPWYVLLRVLSKINKIYIVMRGHTISFIVDILITIMNYEENYPNSWIELNRKRDLLWQIEQVTRCIELYLPLQLRSGDIVTDIWIKETMKQVATALREKKRWVLMSKKDTHDFFIKSIASTLVCIVEDNWDALERMEATKPTPFLLRNVIGRFLLKALRISFIAGVPMVGFFLLQQTSFALSGASYSTAFTLIIIYEISVAGAVLNPNFSTTIANVKDIRSLWH